VNERDRLSQPLDADALRPRVTHAGWRRFDVVAQTGSTNADLLARAASGADIDGAVLIAEHQTAGRGRQGRSWSATPLAQITMSVGVAVVDVPVPRWGWLTLATGVAVLDALDDLYAQAAPHVAANGVQTGLKWPNDVLAGGGKLAGILAEVARPYVVIGLGLNVTQAPKDVDGPGATSLVELGVAAPDRGALVVALLEKLAARIAAWRAACGADPQLAADYRARCLTLGARVRAELPGGGLVVGTARDIDDQGRLCIQTEGGTQTDVTVSAGDVIHLR
jgi:BirA family transcriptional regulator, biotin operon repressor / biotin---[acetyl-CoA-carboxylase] ligase